MSNNKHNSIIYNNWTYEAVNNIVFNSANNKYQCNAFDFPRSHIYISKYRFFSSILPKNFYNIYNPFWISYIILFSSLFYLKTSQKDKNTTKTMIFWKSHSDAFVVLFQQSANQNSK